MNMRTWGLAVFLATLHVLFSTITYTHTGEVAFTATVANGVSLVVLVWVTRLWSLWTMVAGLLVWLTSGIPAPAFASAVLISAIALLLNHDNLGNSAQSLRKRTYV